MIDRNRQIVTDFMAREFPQVQIMKLEGTYLLWMDFNGLGIECHELARILKRRSISVLLMKDIFLEIWVRALRDGIWLVRLGM